jgi:hypothetical protein
MSGSGYLYRRQPGGFAATGKESWEWDEGGVTVNVLFNLAA